MISQTKEKVEGGWSFANKQQQPSLALQHLTCNKSLGLFYIYVNTSSVKIKT
jgi:hypothetical protein